MKKNRLSVCLSCSAFLLLCAISAVTVGQVNRSQAIPGNSTAGQVVQLQGQITEFGFTSPASSILLTVFDSSGVTTWTIEAPSAAQLRRLGWSSSSLFTGEMVRLQARLIPGLTNQAELISLTRANGALMLASAQQDSSQIDLTSVPSGLYRLDSDHAYMTFSYDHLGYSRPQLRFERFSASLNFDAESPASSDVRVEVDVSSLDSGVAALDQELRGTNFFDSLNYPRISFRSSSIEINAWGHAKVTGQIEMKGQARELTLDAQLNSAGLNPLTNMHTIGVSASGKIQRSDWGMDQFIPTVGDEVLINIEAEFVQPISRP